jgi:aquaporin NIP
MSRLRGPLAEFFGTYLLVFLGAGAIMLDARTGRPGHLGVALVFGLTVAGVVLVLGRVSGAHINPAVTLGLAIAQAFPWSRVPAYVGAQGAGALVAALLLRLLLGPVASVGATVPRVSSAGAFALELGATILLLVAVLLVVTGRERVGRLGPFVIGSVVGICAYWIGPLTGAGMNPARSAGPALAAAQWQGLWIYLLAPAAAAALVGLATRAPGTLALVKAGRFSPPRRPARSVLAGRGRAAFGSGQPLADARTPRESFAQPHYATAASLPTGRGNGLPNR